jgi:hypothetical protein
MSYRDPKIIDDKSGLIIPNAIAAGVANIAKQWGAELGRQRDLNLKNRKEDLANDQRVEDEMAAMKAGLKNPPGGQKLVDTAQDVQYAAIDDLGKVRQELNNRDITGERKQELRQEELALLNGLSAMNVSFPKVTIEMDKAVKFKTNSAATQGKTAVTSTDNLAFSYGFHEGTSSYSYTPGKREGGVYVPPKFQIISGKQQADLSQFNSDDFSTTFEVTQLQPEAALAIKNKLKDPKNKFVQGVLQDGTNMSTEDIFDSKGKKTGTRNVVSTLATQETNNFMNDQNAMVQAGIQEAGTPENRRAIMMYQYAMAEDDYNAIYGTGDILDPKSQDGERIDNANNKLRYSIALNNATSADLEITNPDAGPDEPYTYASIYKSNPSKYNPESENQGVKAARLRDIGSTFTSTLKKLGTMEQGAAKDLALFQQATGVQDGMNLGTKSKERRVTGLKVDNAANKITYNVGTPFYGDNLSDPELRAISVVHNNSKTDQVLIDGNLVKASDYLASQGKFNVNARTIDFSNKDSVVIGIMDMYGVDNVQANKYYNTYFN